MTTWHRFARFNAVGALGVALQLTVLGVLTDGLGVGYLPATVLAVGSAIAHNFVWHTAWTWSDRRDDKTSAAGRFLRFISANGAVSMIGSVIVMAALVGGLGLHPIPANGVAIVACGLTNFLLGDHFVFRAGAPLASPARTSVQTRCR
jgi:putative flippase GtrA